MDEGKRIAADAGADFLQGLQQHEIRLRKCVACESVLPPGCRFCPECWSSDLTTVRASGRGRVYSLVVYRRGFAPIPAPPYVVAVIALDEGPRIVATIAGARTDPGVGARVSARFAAEDGPMPLVFEIDPE